MLLFNSSAILLSSSLRPASFSLSDGSAIKFQPVLTVSVALALELSLLCITTFDPEVYLFPYTCLRWWSRWKFIISYLGALIPAISLEYYF